MNFLTLQTFHYIIPLDSFCGLYSIYTIIFNILLSTYFMSKLKFKILKQKWNARVWEIELNWIKLTTPVFMPVGTKATIKGLFLDVLKNEKILWDLTPIKLILANTFHLYLRPWDELIKKAWWLHKFENWEDGLILTDSGGFQVFSLWLGKKEEEVTPLSGGLNYRRNLPYDPKLKDRARELRKNMTKAEKKMKIECLDKLNFKFYRQRPIDSYIVDFYCSKLWLVIEIDWNTHWSKKEIEYDNKRTKKLESYWLRVVRFTNNEIFENIEWVYLKLQEYIKPLLTPPIKRGMHQHNVDIKLVEDGVHFRSPYDGSKHFFSPEKVVDIQCNLWSDIMMVLDVCSPWNSDKKTLYSQMQQTHRWAKRAYDHFMKKYDKVKWVLFPIVQWWTDLEMRKESAEYLSQFATDGIAIWWVSVWESKEKVREVVEFTTPLLPKDKPRYLMWVGTPEDLLHAIEHWVDMFDCVLATRFGRHGVAFSDKWNVNLNNAKFKEDFNPLDDTVEWLKNYSKSYINHLLKENEMLWWIILSLHNILYLHKILENWKKRFLED